MKHNKALMNTAIVWSKESYCKDKQVGACISMNSRVQSTGFNGTLSGQTNMCEELIQYRYSDEVDEYAEKCMKCNGSGIVSEFIVVAVIREEPCETCNGIGYLKNTMQTQKFTHHAEFNAIITAQHEGKSLIGADIHITMAPCYECSRLIAASKIKSVTYLKEYSDMSGVEYLKLCGIECLLYQE